MTSLPSKNQVYNIVPNDERRKAIINASDELLVTRSRSMSGTVISWLTNLAIGIS